ncbi:uncharacterized protein DKFZp434B061-like [Melospiza melodia melodia]|uniref:uncharacterized protein DKFZp434B061-like n=1 Tax=Melospiza melodia melodia TaxID=1914991 RepID=UPI002FD502F1
MRRRRGGGAAPAEACGVWLDTAELKRGRARPLTLRAPRAAGRKQSLGLLPQPGSSGDSTSPRHSINPGHSCSSWQSSILSFFSPQPDDKENIRPAAPCEEPLVKILPLPQLEGAREELQGPARAAQTAPELRVGSQGLSRASPGARGRSWGRDRDKPWVSPAGTAPGARTALPCPRAGAGGTNPAPGAAPSRVCCSPQSPGPAQPLRERGQLRAGPCRESQGRDRDRDSPNRDRDSPCRDRASPNRESQGRDRDRASPCRDRDSPRFPLRATPSPPEPPELGSEPLFTQDSEGNRVIKHW